MTIHALAPQCAERQEQYFELFRMQYSQNFLPPPPPGLQWGKAYSPNRLPCCTMVFLLAMLFKKPAPPPPPKKKIGYSIDLLYLILQGYVHTQN